MTVLCVPRDTGPSLGPAVQHWIENNLVFGPGTLQGQPARLDREKSALLYKAYELHPRGTPSAGLRRFHRVAVEMRKGLAKTEFASWVTAAELARYGYDAAGNVIPSPVRFDRWDPDGNPLGKCVEAPFIPMMAAAEEQVQELAYGVLMWILEHSPIADQFDIGLQRIVRLAEDGTRDGEAMAVSNAPATRDGARTTFQTFDEPHRLHLELQRQAHETMIQNLHKRQTETPWALYTSTAGSPGQGSVQEDVRAEAEKIDKGNVEQPRLFFYSRWAGPEFKDLSSRDQRIAAIKSATGPIAGEWGPDQYVRIADDWERVGNDKAYWERVWLNRWRQSGAAMFDVKNVKTIRGVEIPPGAFIASGFDGSKRKDSTAMVITDIATGYQQLVGLWEKDDNNPDWEVDTHDVAQTLSEVRLKWRHWRMYGDPPYWTEELASWAALYPGEIAEVWTNQQRRMSDFIRAYLEALDSGACTIVGTDKQISDMLRHLGNAGRRELNILDDEGKPRHLMCHQDGRLADKYDAAVAAVLSWAACLEARRRGAEPPRPTGIPRRIR